jgi:nucleoside-diphosphate-sugar epimerase
MLPQHIDSETQLEDLLSEPTDEDVAAVSRLEPDILILGAGGKMGPSLARRVRRAAERAGNGSRVLAVSRFSSREARESLEADGIPTLACDFTSAPAITGLPRFPNVLFLAGRKFGTTDRTDITWTTNTVVPARVAEHFREARMVVFSTGNVYPLVPAGGPAPSTRSPVSAASASSSSYPGRTAFRH